MAKFARIIELENDEQLLITIGVNTDKDCYTATISIEVDNVGIDTEMGFDTKEIAVEFMENCTVAEAASIRNNLIDFLMNG